MNKEIWGDVKELYKDKHIGHSFTYACYVIHYVRDGGRLNDLGRELMIRLHEAVGELIGHSSSFSFDHFKDRAVVEILDPSVIDNIVTDLEDKFGGAE